MKFAAFGYKLVTTVPDWKLSPEQRQVRDNVEHAQQRLGDPPEKRIPLLPLKFVKQGRPRWVKEHIQRLKHRQVTPPLGSAGSARSAGTAAGTTAGISAEDRMTQLRNALYAWVHESEDESTIPARNAQATDIMERIRPADLSGLDSKSMYLALPRNFGLPGDIQVALGQAGITVISRAASENEAAVATPTMPGAAASDRQSDKSVSATSAKGLDISYRENLNKWAQDTSASTDTELRQRRAVKNIIRTAYNDKTASNIVIDLGNLNALTALPPLPEDVNEIKVPHQLALTDAVTELIQKGVTVTVAPSPETESAPVAALPPLNLIGEEYTNALNAWLKQPETNDQSFVKSEILKQINDIRYKPDLTQLDLSDYPNVSSLPPFPTRMLKLIINPHDKKFTTAVIAELEENGITVVKSAEKAGALKPGSRRQSTSDILTQTPGAGPSQVRRPGVVPHGSAVRPSTPTAQPTASVIAGRARQTVLHRDYADHGLDVRSASANLTSTAPAMTYEDKLNAWIDKLPAVNSALSSEDLKAYQAEKTARINVANAIQTWITTRDSQPNAPVPPLDLSATKNGIITTMPPIPDGVSELILKGQSMMGISLRSLPSGWTKLDLTDCQLLMDIDIADMQVSGFHPTVVLGETKLKARVLRKLLASNQVAFGYHRPTGARGEAYYVSNWENIENSLKTWIDKAPTERESKGRMKAMEKIEAWMHHDNGENATTPLSFENLSLHELPPVLPEDLKYLFAPRNQIQSISIRDLPPGLTVLDLRNNEVKEMPTVEVSNAGRNTLLSIGLDGNPIPHEIVNRYKEDESMVEFVFDDKAFSQLLKDEVPRPNL